LSTTLPGTFPSFVLAVTPEAPGVISMSPPGIVGVGVGVGVAVGVGVGVPVGVGVGVGVMVPDPVVLVAISKVNGPSNVRSGETSSVKLPPDIESWGSRTRWTYVCPLIDSTLSISNGSLMPVWTAVLPTTWYVS
jgi:hypothetical protein